MTVISRMARYRGWAVGGWEGGGVGGGGEWVGSRRRAKASIRTQTAVLCVQ